MSKLKRNPMCPDDVARIAPSADAAAVGRMAAAAERNVAAGRCGKSSNGDINDSHGKGACCGGCARNAGVCLGTDYAGEDENSALRSYDCEVHFAGGGYESGSDTGDSDPYGRTRYVGGDDGGDYESDADDAEGNSGTGYAGVVTGMGYNPAVYDGSESDTNSGSSEYESVSNSGGDEVGVRNGFAGLRVDEEDVAERGGVGHGGVDDGSDDGEGGEDGGSFNLGAHDNVVYEGVDDAQSCDNGGDEGADRVGVDVADSLSDGASEDDDSVGEGRADSDGAAEDNAGGDEAGFDSEDGYGCVDDSD